MRVAPVSGSLTCIFCGRSPTTREHVWSKWLRNHIPRTMTKWESYKATIHLAATDTGVWRRPGDPHDWQVRCVCAACNNGWMSDLERRVRPVLAPLVEGRETRVTEQEQLALATWCVLKAMVSEYDDPERVTVHHMQRRRMWRKRLPPVHGWRVWVGHYERQRWVPNYISNAFAIRPGPPPKEGPFVPKRYNTHSMTLVAGKLFIHVIHSPYLPLVRLWQFPPGVAGKLRQIWPLSGYSFVWPATVMTDADADSAASAFFAFAKASADRQYETPTGKLRS